MECPSTKCCGDSDPLDVVEIGSQALPTGAVVPVKPLGVLAMIDDGELDWKVIAVNAHDPLSTKLNNIHDVEEHCPGTISGIREWFRWYKTPDGKPLNAFGFDGEALDRSKAFEVIDETHEHWKHLVAGRVDKEKLWVPTEASTYYEATRTSNQTLNAMAVAGHVGKAKSSFRSRL